MGKNKLKKFAEIETLPNVFEYAKEMKGKWLSAFDNKNPIVLELACGRGEYTNGMAELFPNKNFIGVDIKGSRIWHGATYAHQNRLKNVAFLRTQIESLPDYFSENEISEIWITFPDPHPSQRRSNKRLTSPRFLEYYRNILQPNGLINLKTDNDALMAYTQEVLSELNIQPKQITHDVYNADFLDKVLQIKTNYERKYLEKGKNINYLQFSF